MFRSRRSSLLKRLWKCQLAPTSDDPTCPTEDELRTVVQGLLKTVSETELDSLVRAVESGGGERTDCVLVARGPCTLARGRTLAPHQVCCELWRWRGPVCEQSLKTMPVCGSSSSEHLVCCNPYHWSRLQPGPLTDAVSLDDKTATLSEKPVLVTSSSSVAATTSTREAESADSSTCRYWCHIAYWERRERVGRLYTVLDDAVNVFQSLARGDGMCLSLLQTWPPNHESVGRTREKIGHGLTLSREGDAVWVYNCSLHPLFINSPLLDHISGVVVVQKLLPGYALKVFSYSQWSSWAASSSSSTSLLDDGPFDTRSIRISFAKGWGTSYSRQFVTCCPCWLEVLLRTKR